MAESNIWKNQTDSWCRLCPICSDTIEHTGIHAKRNALRPFKKGVSCRKCSMTGKVPSVETRKKLSDSLRGKPVPLSRRIKISKSLSGRSLEVSQVKKITDSMIRRYSNEEERNKTRITVLKAMRRPDIRKKHLAGLHRSKWLKVKTDDGQLEMIEKWNRLGFHFEPNYQIHTDIDLFYVDGYDKEKNVVLEYDSKYHHRKQQKEKDLIRQQKIIDILKPKKFWRYDAVNKQCRNILGG
jgi:hypothetical protein